MSLPATSLVGRRWWPGLPEGLLAAVSTILSVWVLGSAGTTAGFQRPDALGYTLTGLGGAAVLGGRRRPLAALVVTGCCSTLLAWLDQRVDVLPFVVTGLLFMVGRLPRRPAVTGIVFASAALVVAAFSRAPDLGSRSVLQSTGIFLTAWVLGRLSRARREVLLAQVDAAERQAAVEREQAAAERDRGTLAQVEERLRIARELHDVLAHSISVISVQATVGEHLAATDPPAAREALQTIGDVSRSSMQELRQLLTLLRDRSSPAAADTVSYEPARGLADLVPLVERYGSAGLPVHTEISGAPRRLSASADLCAYRIVQESLTNTLKHAGPSDAVVRLSYGADALTVDVHDDGLLARLPAPHGTGHGLVGMRERTALLGGTFRAGPDPSGGFAVSATIPYEPGR
ncbi:sensor histidine kinase [uncultured Friedmanniella sp.]|uniref:sensor histidine kinase n=1 Tax=uncultured Friedmanniella sp. TaxID=335381 RepID=UPI0035CA4917